MNQNTPYTFLYVLFLLFLPIASFRSLSGGAGLGGLGVMLEVYFASFIVLTISLIICLILSRKDSESKMPKYIFISGIVLAFIVNEIICVPNRSKNNNEEYFMSREDYPVIRKKFFSKSISVVGESEYYKVYSQANDSINNWIQNHLLVTSNQIKSSNWELDSLICFNSDGNKCIMSILNQGTMKQDTMDIKNSADYLYGIKIKDRWYFFIEPSYTLDFRTDILSFQELKESVIYNIYIRYLRKDKYKWKINPKFFLRVNNDANDTLFTVQEKWEKSWLKLVEENWSKKDK